MKLILEKLLSPGQLRTARYIDELLVKAGYEAYLVGGSVRDLLLGKKISDLDFTTNAVPQEVMRIFPRVIPVGVEFGTVIVTHEGRAVEITTYRHDTEYEDGRRPKSVHFGHTLEEDVQRRDFTINGMAVNVRTQEVVDFSSGVEDLQKKIVRTIGNPVERFREDGLRPIRGCRFAAALQFEIESETFSAMQQTRDTIARVAMERFYDEWRKTLKIKRKGDFWNYLFKAEIFSLFLSEFKNLMSEEGVLKLVTLLNSIHVDRMAAYAAYLFYVEFSLESELTSDAERKKFMNNVLRKIRFPLKEKNLALALIDTPLLSYFRKNEHERTTLKGALSEINRHELIHHIRFVLNIIRFEKGKEETVSLVRDFVCQVRDIFRSREPLYISDLVISGNEIKAAGYTGKEIREKLEQLLSFVHSNPKENETEKLMQFLKGKE